MLAFPFVVQVSKVKGLTENDNKRLVAVHRIGGGQMERGGWENIYFRRTIYPLYRNKEHGEV